jgi:hypothetical protein
MAEPWWAELEDIVAVKEEAGDSRADVWFTVAISRADTDARLHCRPECSVVRRDRALYPLAPLMPHEPRIYGDQVRLRTNKPLWRRLCVLCAPTQLLAHLIK